MILWSRPAAKAVLPWNLLSEDNDIAVEELTRVV